MRPATLLLLAPLVVLGCARATPDPAASRQPAPERRILVFAKTAGFRHSSIPAGKAAILRLGRENGFLVDTTEDAGRFTTEGLAPYRAVVFLSTTGNVLDDAQQAALERFVRGGGGYVGVHAAADTEYDWPWYGRLVGAYFASHPPGLQTGTFRVLDKSHPATQGLPDRWERTDEFYNFKQMNPDVRVLVTVDETTYRGGTNGPNHPMAWYHAYDGGRAFYTALGHTDASFAEPLFLAHLLGGIRWAMGLTTG
jgi:type 1 glutamine amidotransferase